MVYNDRLPSWQYIYNVLTVSKIQITCNCSIWFSFAGFGLYYHYNGVIMSAMASQITGFSIVCSIVSSDADQRKHQSYASLAFVWGIHRGPVNSVHKGPVARKMFPFDDVSWFPCLLYRYHGITRAARSFIRHSNQRSALLVLCAKINHMSPVTTHHRRPIMQKGFPSHHVVIHYRQKIWNNFYSIDCFAFLWSVQGVSVLEIHSYEQILLLGELIST